MLVVTKYQNTIADAVTGRPVPGCLVTVADHASGAAAVRYDQNGVQQNTPVLSDAAGNYSFYVVPGRYDIAITRDGISALLTDILIQPTVLEAGSPAERDAIFAACGPGTLVIRLDVLTGTTAPPTTTTTPAPTTTTTTPAPGTTTTAAPAQTAPYATGITLTVTETAGTTTTPAPTTTTTPTPAPTTTTPAPTTTSTTTTPAPNNTPGAYNISLTVTES